MENQKEEIQKPNVLLLKFSGKPTLIFKLLAELPKIIPENSMYTSQLLKNKGIPGFHLFCKITYPLVNAKKNIELERDDIDLDKMEAQET